ncbi:cation:proton antiporter [Paraoerskovia marina]|uniref:cation:proton antiporter n=1 Tax=Paraoerskovia marina TaxID=545619 RepID=UPI000492CA6C|nr:sodium:proton antiporter [Paraoerskovia marina]
MDYALVAVVGVLAIVGVSVLGPRVGVAPPLLLVLFGVGLSLVPGVPPVEVEPEIVLAGVLPPLLYSSAVSMPTMDFRRDFRSIAGLSVVLVVLTSFVLGAIFSWLIPGVDLATGVALGAVVSPTDAVATSIVRRLGVSPRIVTILEGEGLLNDASALVLLRTAIAATAISVSFWEVLGDFVLAVGIAGVVGYLVGNVSLRIRSRLTEPASSTVISFATPFVAYFPSEALEASGLVAAVTAGLVVGQGAPRFLTPTDRLSERTNWQTVEILLEGAVFLILGLELLETVEDVRQTHGSIASAIGLAALAALVIVLVRAAYVAPLLLGASRRARKSRAERPRVEEFGVELERRVEQMRADERFDDERTGRRIDHGRRRLSRRLADIDYVTAAPLGWREGTVLVWAGMRGAVTVAAAQTLPSDTVQRPLLLLIAFAVAISTLFVQGGTLPWVVHRLGLGGAADGDGDERDALMQVMNRAVADVLEDENLRRADGSEFNPAVLGKIRARVARRTAEGAEIVPREISAQIFELQIRVIQAQREALLEARSLGTFDSSGLSAALAVLDANEISARLTAGPDGPE